MSAPRPHKVITAWLLMATPRDVEESATNTAVHQSLRWTVRIFTDYRPEMSWWRCVNVAFQSPLTGRSNIAVDNLSNAMQN